VGMRASRWDANRPASPTSFKRWSPIFPWKWSNAARATSGPMPDGSPMVIRIGCPPPLADERIGFAVVAHLDIGIALQVAQIAPRQGGDLALAQLVFHLLAGGHHIGGLGFDPLVAAPDQFHARVRQERHRRFAGMGDLH